MESSSNLIHEAKSLIFGHNYFRGIQEDIINAIMNEKDVHDVFVIMPTGGGKSLLYQLPAVLTKGVTIVISPLLSLIEDQVGSLCRMISGGIPAAYLSSTVTPKMEEQVIADLNRSNHGHEPYLKLLYLTPERIVKSRQTQEMLTNLYNNEFLARFVIDEAHCVSSWGHDFRPDYQALSMIKRKWEEAQIVALTATARCKIAQNVKESLCMDNCLFFSAGYDRPNLYFMVTEKEKEENKALQQIRNYVISRKGQCGIVYCMTRNETETMADYLRAGGIKADYYHAGQSASLRQNVQMGWTQDKIDVVCATIAYGMGIDKKDVRYVLHYSLAKSIEGYYQEAGRAGRDGQPSECIIYFRQRDVNLLQRIMRTGGKRISENDTTRLQEMVEYCEDRDNCRRSHFCSAFGGAAINGAQGQTTLKTSTVFKRCGNKCDVCKPKTPMGSSLSSHLLSCSSSIAQRPITTNGARSGQSNSILNTNSNKITNSLYRPKYNKTNNNHNNNNDDDDDNEVIDLTAGTAPASKFKSAATLVSSASSSSSSSKSNSNKNSLSSFGFGMKRKQPTTNYILDDSEDDVEEDEEDEPVMVNKRKSQFATASSFAKSNSC